MSNTALALSPTVKNVDKNLSDNSVQQARRFNDGSSAEQAISDSEVKFALNVDTKAPVYNPEPEEHQLISQNLSDQSSLSLDTEAQTEAQLVLFSARTPENTSDAKETSVYAKSDTNLLSATTLHDLLSGKSLSKTSATVAQLESAPSQAIQNTAVSSIQGAIAVSTPNQMQAQQLSTDKLAFTSSPAQGSVWAPVKIDTNAGKWGEQMMQVLHDRVSLQANQNVQEARIRLDPPELGKLDLMVRVEGDRLNVQLNANAMATRDALVQISDRLRAELQNQNFVHVDVSVGSGDAGSHQSQQQNEQDQDQHIFASREFSTDGSSLSQSERWLSTQA